METHEIKHRLTELLIDVLEKERKSALRGEKEAKEEAAYHKGAMESRYDTFKEEAQYMASGHVRRRIEIEQWLKELQAFSHDARCFFPSDNVHLGTIVTIGTYATGERVTYFVVPAGGGNTFDVNNESFTTLNTASPLAESMILKGEGDEVSSFTNGNKKKFVILRIR